jgi:hypothetical protein
VAALVSIRSQLLDFMDLDLERLPPASAFMGQKACTAQEIL